METNGWTFHDRVHLESRDWGNVLDALSAAARAGRKASKRWPARTITEQTKLIADRDQHTPTRTLTAALRRARIDPTIAKVSFDLSQGGTDDPSEREFARVRCCLLTAVRDSGLTLYVSHPNEPEVPQLLAALIQPARDALTRRHGWRHWVYQANRIRTDSLVAPLLAAGILGALATLLALKG